MQDTPHIRQAFIGALLLILAGAWLLASSEIDTAMNEIRTEESIAVRLGRGALVERLEAISNDITYLSRQSALRDAIKKKTPESLNHLAEDFQNFVISNRVYNQARWIDPAGMETLRVDFADGKAWRIPQDQLQNKGARYYFTDSIKLKAGEIYVSPLDLNIEGDSIEIPFKPMIRFATPIRNEIGQPAGIVILNYLAQNLLDAFATATVNAAAHIMLLNADGFWLVSPNSDDQWGFMFKRPDKSLAVRDPEAWKIINNSEAGQIEIQSGFWTWTTVHTLLEGQVSSSGAAEAAAASSEMLGADPSIWKVVAHLPKPKLTSIRQMIILRTAVIAALFILILAYFSSSLSKAWETQLKAENRARQANNALQAALDEIDRANQGLAEQLGRYRIIIDATTDGFAVLDAKGHILEHNRALPEMLGMNDIQLPAGNLNDLHCPDNNNTLLPALQATIKNKTHRWEGILCKTNGKQINVDISAAHDPGLGIMAFIRNISQRKKLEAELQKLATTDPLTELPNRRYVMQRMEQELDRLKRMGGLPSSLLMLDIDHFKSVNDSFGHATGDEVLRAFADLLKRSLRKTDLAGRIGGEEFVVMLTGTGTENALTFAGKLLQQTAELEIACGKKMIHFTVSIGVTLMTATDATTDITLARADKALYAAKDNGRNRIETSLPKA